MRATLLLADSAQVADGKLYLLGGGWNITGPQPTPFALAMLIEVPWDRANEEHQLRVECLDADGALVLVSQSDEGEQPLAFEARFEIGRPPGIKRGAPLNVPLAINLPPQQFVPNSRYEWRLSINGQTDEEWRVTFSTRPAGPQET
ncbi:MAG TPA: hypothetical protein VH276_05870 [Solirubrobacteraceae bacterium]|jgi:hypothetical protein|nr:hypothetical protein [Solirubrobacteraceae bacterium]